GVRFRFRAEELATELHDGQEPPAKPKDQGAMHPLERASSPVRVEPHHLEEARLGNRESLADALDDEGWDDGEGERNLDPHARPCAVPRLQLYRAAELLDVRPHDVHPDASAGELRHALGGREAGEKEQLK